MNPTKTITAKSRKIALTKEAEQVIANLRAEVATQKDCITRYTIMSIAFVGGVWGLAAKLDGFNIPFYFSSALLVFMLTVVVRLSNHKYATINRHLGYELHLARLIDYARVGNADWASRMMDIKWEEAMCAWRFVQPAIFSRVYFTSDEDDGFDETFKPYTRKPDQCVPMIDGKIIYYWYESESLMAERAAYHSGKYLQNIHRFLYTVSGLTVISMWGIWGYQIFAFILRESLNGASTPADSWLAILGFAIAAVMNIGISNYTWIQIQRQTGYREILESGILSIQTTAVVWRVVATCHILGSSWALDLNKSYRFYTTYTSALAVDFIEKNFHDPHGWLKKFEDAFDAEERDGLLSPKMKELLSQVLADRKPTPFERKHLKPGYPKTLGKIVKKIFKVFRPAREKNSTP